MRTTLWNDILFGALLRVNHSLHLGGPMPSKGEKGLWALEGCLCSGDGLSRRSAFRADSLRTAERVLSLVGLSDRVTSRQVDGDQITYRLGVNPLCLDAVHFRLEH